MFLFYDPVDTTRYTDYLDHVEKPMDYSTIKFKLNNNAYEGQEEFKEDVLLVFQNCIKYNGESSAIAIQSKNLTLEFLDTFKKEFG